MESLLSGLSRNGYLILFVAAFLESIGLPIPAALALIIAGAAVARVRQAGACALRRSVFEPLPGQGRWATALLADGNIGIGGNPVVLLCRVAALLRAGGRALIEVEEPGIKTRRARVRVEHARGRSRWIP